MSMRIPLTAVAFLVLARVSAAEPALNAIEPVPRQDARSQIEQRAGLVLVDLYADW